MASVFTIKPTHKAIRNYYDALATYADQSVGHEGALTRPNATVRPAQ